MQVKRRDPKSIMLFKRNGCVDNKKHMANYHLKLINGPNVSRARTINLTSNCLEAMKFFAAGLFPLHLFWYNSQKNLAFTVATTAKVSINN